MRAITRGEVVAAELRRSTGHEQVSALARDRSALACVRAAAEPVLRSHPTLPRLINTAGVDTPVRTTHLGPVLRTTLPPQVRTGQPGCSLWPPSRPVEGPEQRGLQLVFQRTGLVVPV